MVNDTDRGTYGCRTRDYEGKPHEEAVKLTIIGLSLE